MRPKMRILLVQRLFLRILSMAQHNGPSQRREAASNMHWTAPRKVVHTQIVQPAVRIPFKVCEHVVDKRSPAEQKQHGGPEAATLEHGTCEDHGGARHKCEAEASVEDIGDVGVGERGVGEYIVEAREGKVAEEGICCVGLVQRVSALRVNPELNN